MQDEREKRDEGEEETEVMLPEGNKICNIQRGSHISLI